MAESHGLSVEELARPNLRGNKEFIEMAKDKNYSQKLNDLVVLYLIKYIHRIHY